MNMLGDNDFIPISKINDFLFCHYSLYLHMVYEGYDATTYQSEVQVAGKLAHKSIDNKVYSSAKRYLQSLSVIGLRLGISGKIDILDQYTMTLIERKNRVSQLYDGQVYQVYAQYYCLLEMGYNVRSLIIHSLQDNKNYRLSLPGKVEAKKLENTLKMMRNFQPQSFITGTNMAKCRHCIYYPLCV